MTEQSDDQQTHERLRNEATDLLLAASSPARNIPELKPLIDEHEGLVQRRAELNALEAKLAEVLPVVEQAEADVVAAEKQVAAEKKQLASFAGKLGQAVFAGFQAGELPDQPAIGPRKELQARIDALQQQRSSLLAEEKTTFLDKTKQQAQQLALAGQIKVEEFRIPAADRALGEAILGSKEKQILKSSHTESVLKAILEQKQRVGVARDRHKAAEEAAAQRKTECGAKLGRGPVQSLDLKAELKELRSEVGRNSKRISSLRDQLVDVANKSEVATRDSTLGSKLAELTTVRESIAANRPQLVNALGAAADQLTKLPAGKRRLAIVVSGAVLAIVLFGFFARGPLREEASSTSPDWIKSWEGAGATFTSGEAGGPDTITIQKWKDGMVSNLPRPSSSFSLHLTGSGITDEGLKEIAALHKVTAVLLSDNEITDQGLESLGNLTNLIELSLKRTKVSSIRHLAKLRGLKYLWLEGSEVTDAGMEDLGDLNELAILNLSRTKITDATLERIGKYEKLNTLTIASTPITDAGLKFVGKISGLKLLDIGDTNITDSGIKNLEALGQLESLSCDRTRITDRGVLKIVAKFDKLESLSLGGTRVSDAGLFLLSESKSLESVFLLRCPNVSAEGVKALETKLPSLKVEYSGGLDETPKANSSSNLPANNTPSPLPPAASMLDLMGDKFRYTFNGKSYTGATKQGVGEIVSYDTGDTLFSFTVDKSNSTVVSNFLGVTDGRLHLGAGKENITLQLTFRVESQPKEEVRGLVTATYLRPGPSYKTHWFGKPASSVPKDEQEIVFRKGAFALVGLGIPFKIEANSENVRVLYADFSPTGQLAMLKDMIADPQLKFVIGDRTLRIDDSARRTIYLLERAVAVLRYRQGIRDAASRPSLGD